MKNKFFNHKSICMCLMLFVSILTCLVTLGLIAKSNAGYKNFIKNNINGNYIYSSSGVAFERIDKNTFKITIVLNSDDYHLWFLNGEYLNVYLKDGTKLERGIYLSEREKSKFHNKKSVTFECYTHSSALQEANTENIARMEWSTKKSFVTRSSSFTAFCSLFLVAIVFVIVSLYFVIIIILEYFKNKSLNAKTITNL